MIVANFTTNRPTMGETRTYEDFYKFLGVRPNRMGIVSKMYEDLTASYLTEALRNIVYMDSQKTEKFRPIDAMMFEWEIETNEIKRIRFAAVPEGTGADGSDITMAFTENWFQKYDIIRNEKTRQQYMAISRPLRKADNYWEIIVRLIDNNYQSVLDTTGCQVGDTCVFQSVAMPELSEEGYTKYQSSVEKHRNYITTFRVDESWSSLYAAHEDVFVNIAKGEGNGRVAEVTYKMNKKEKDLLDNFMYVRANGLLFNKTNVDPVTGKPTIQDPDTNRGVYIGEGLIPQIEAFASKYGYNKLTVDVFKTVLNTMNEKANSPTGNHYIFIINEKLWSDVQDVLGDLLFKFKTNGTFFWSKDKNEYVQVGATYNSYEFAGNFITFKVDRTYSREYGNEKGYGTCLNLTADKTSGTPAIEMFTLKGGDFITSKFPGVGGLGGLESGIDRKSVV